MLSGLRHDAFISGHYQHNQIHPDDTGNHVVDEPLMSGYIDDTDPVTALQIKISKTQIDGNSAP